MEFDCIVLVVSKDSCYASHILKFKYGMNPLTVTFPIYIQIMDFNYKNWLSFGNHQYNRKKIRKNHDTIKFSILNLMPFSNIHVGQKIFAVKNCKNLLYPVFFGENEAEHGNAIANYNSLSNKFL